MKKFIPTILLISLISFSTFAQNVIKGVVLDSEENNPLKGVSVDIKDTTLRVLTNENGVFILENLSSGSVLIQISYPEYETQNFPVELNGKTIDLGTILLYKDFASSS